MIHAQAAFPACCGFRTFRCLALPDQIRAWSVCWGQQLPLCILSTDVFKVPTGRKSHTSTVQLYVIPHTFIAFTCVCLSPMLHWLVAAFQRVSL